MNNYIGLNKLMPLDRPVYFCGYSLLATVLKLYGIDFLGDVLGTEWGFRYDRYLGGGIGEEYEKWKAQYSFSTEISSVKKLLNIIYGIKIEHYLAKTYDDILLKISSLLAHGTLCIVSCDPFSLPYFLEYNKFHPESPHYILVYKIDPYAKIVFYYDAYRSFIEGAEHTISFERFHEFFKPENNLFHLDYSIQFVTVPANYATKIDRKDYFIESLKAFGGAEKEKDVPKVPIQGLMGLRELAKDIELISKCGNVDFMQSIIENLRVQTILACQQRYANVQFLTRNKNDFSNNFVKCCEDVFRSWHSLRVLFFNIRKRSESELLFMAAKQLSIIYGMENTVYDLLD
jgi:hypothetical protein